MEPEGIVDFQSANSINDIHDRKMAKRERDIVSSKKFDRVDLSA